MKKIFLAFFAVALSLTLTAQIKTKSAKFLKHISGDEMLKHIEYFASPELDGRFPASNGYKKASAYAAAYFKTLGLKPLPGNTFLQQVPVEYNEFTGPVKLEKITNGIHSKKYRHGTDFVCRGFSGSGKISTSVVFCGYGVSFPEIGYDDYANTDVSGKIVMVFKQNPSFAKDVSNINEKSTRYKANIAAAKGAKAILFVSQPNIRDPQKPIGSIMDGEGEYNPDFPQLQISIEIADELLKNSGKKLSELQKIIDSLKKPFYLETNDSLYIEVTTKYEKERFSENVVALLPGTDNVLKDEYLIIGAHLDHVGRQDKIFFPGANDNASGSAAVMQLAKAFVKSGIKPKRSVCFVLFTSEEQGLLGSKYFAEHPPFPIENAVAMLNLDCIGHGDSIQIGGGRSAPLLWKKAKAYDSVFFKKMINKTWHGGGADAQAFFEKNIPTLYFVSYYSYTHLHLPSDTPQTINTSLLEQITKLAFLVAFDIVNGEYSKEKITREK